MILRGGRIRSIYRLFTTITLPSKSPGSPRVLFMVNDLISLLLSPNIHQSIYLNSSIQTYNTENHRKVSETSIGVIKAPLKVSKNQYLAVLKALKHYFFFLFFLFFFIFFIYFIFFITFSQNRSKLFQEQPGGRKEVGLHSTSN